jgi:hypothetical protein
MIKTFAQKYPELDAISDDIAVLVAKEINKRVTKEIRERTMPYANQGVLEEVIKKLEKLV